MRIFKKSNIEFSKEKEPKTAGKIFESFKEYLDIQKLNKDNIINQLPFILFLSLLAIFYIGNQFHAEKLVNEVEQLKKVRNEKRAEFISSASDLMRITRQSEVMQLVDEYQLGLKPLTAPPKKIVIPK